MRRTLRIVAALTGVAALLLVGVGYSLQKFMEAVIPLTAPVTLVISKGSGLSGISKDLRVADVVASPLFFRLGAMMAGKTKLLKAGEYAFQPGMTHQSVMDKMVLGDVVVHQFTLVEGRTVRQVQDELRFEKALEGDVGPLLPEGSLLPETYNFILGEARSQMIQRMRRSMETALAEAWAGRAEGLTLASPHELLILASIIERETGLAAERPHVSAVFHNRLKKGMRLQSDPTVIYALSDGLGVLERPLSRADLERPTPFNTYVINRLPPEPIANPGRASLQAAAHPLNSDDLYFVADGTGGHAFAPTLEAHNRNVANWRRIEKER
ncbi:MAG: endolytic transglycosylase MltG [Alphaproteobacteria bacterium]|nr:endolytic transglycosylase MltG [Alphaproteobacteria bacterium]